MSRRASLTVLSLFASISVSAAQDAGVNIVMEPPGEPGGVSTVIGGTPVSPKFWPATLRFATSAALCSSTVIGKRVVLTAAHCVEDGAHATVKTPGSTTQIVCSRHPDYAQDFQRDIALCKSDGDIVLAPEVKYETINTDAKRPVVKNDIVLLGYGCRQVGGGGASGELYQGSSKVQKLSGEYIVTRGGAALCFGDSGGGAYLQVTNERRVLVGVNSRGDISTESQLSNMAAPSIVQFVADWSATNGVKVCGLGEEKSRCHE